MKANPFKYPVGTRVYYTGDMANMPSEGTITNLREPSRFGGWQVDIKYDEERFEGDTERASRGISLAMFEPGPGRRFVLLSEYQAERQAKIDQYKATAAN